MGVYKRCACRDSNGQQLGNTCPKLRGGRHGSWYYVTDLPSARGRRKQHRRGGYATRGDAEDALRAVRSRLDVGATVDDRQTVADWLTEWMAGQQLRPSTERSYASHIRVYLVPHLGHIPLEKLRTAHVADMFRAIAAGEDPPGPGTVQRIRATLRSALSDAVRQQRVAFNAAKLVKLPSGAAPRAVVWTDDRVQAWRNGGRRPKVAVWTPALTGQFLDAVQADRLYGCWHLLVFTGLRRGEAAGLRWVDVDLDAGQLTVAEQLVQLGTVSHAGAPKSASGERVVPLDGGTVAVLRAHRAQQNADRLAWGEAWIPSGRVFCREDGQQLSPDHLSGRFKRLIAANGLPPIRLHDLRHGAATLTLAGGASMKVVSELLGHSQVSLTANTYTSVLPEMSRAAAEQAAALVPRLRRDVTTT